jgi:predicted tellurium resistance membrane protein TerC
LPHPIGLCDISANLLALEFAGLASHDLPWQRDRMDIIALLYDPTAWVALLTLIALEIVLGIDNLVFIAIISNKLPAHQQTRARRIGLTLALAMRIVLLLLIGWIVTLQQPLFDLGMTGEPGPHGEPGFETAFSGRDLILIAGGLFLLWKATKEIHHNLDPEGDSGELLDHDKGLAKIGFNAAIAQIIALDLVFSVDSILTAVGMTDQVPIMIAAVVFTVGVMMLAADPLSRFIEHNPTLVMLALAFLVMIGVVLLADGFGVHIPKGYIYAAMGFSALVETLNIIGRGRRQRKALAAKDLG